MDPLRDIRSNNWHDLMIKIDKEFKRQSREDELDFLKMDFPEDLKEEMIERERAERRELDEDIKYHRKKLLKTGGKKNVR